MEIYLTQKKTPYQLREDNHYAMTSEERALGLAKVEMDCTQVEDTANDDNRKADDVDKED